MRAAHTGRIKVGFIVVFKAVSGDCSPQQEYNTGTARGTAVFPSPIPVPALTVLANAVCVRG